MKKIYEIDLTTTTEEPDIYFTSMSPREVDVLHEFLTRQKVVHTITAITDSPGYHSFSDLLFQWKEQYATDKDWSPREE